MGRLVVFLRKQRKIKEVNSWDGSASNYSTAKAFADASLINFNTGSTDTWTKSLVKLPVRNEGDSSDTFIKQAVQAASGGRGITAVKRPDGVSQETFNSKLKSAANTIIRAYNEWGGTAPESVYNIAGKNRPEKRAIPFEDIYEAVGNAVWLADEAERTFTLLYDMFYEYDQIFALGMRDGIVYKIETNPVMNEEMTGYEYVELGEFIPITPEDSFASVASTKQNRIKVYRDKHTKKMRWLSIASVAVLNRVGQIDSTELFDSFIGFAKKTRVYPELNVYHLGRGSKVGQADYLARRGYVYIASGTFDDTPHGRKFYEALQGKDNWGNSIEFYSPRAYIETFELRSGTQIQVPVHKKGINTGITLVSEKDAASIFTLHRTYK